MALESLWRRTLIPGGLIGGCASIVMEVRPSIYYPLSEAVASATVHLQLRSLNESDSIHSISYIAASAAEACPGNVTFRGANVRRRVRASHKD